MLSRVECVQLCPIIELYGIPPATASHFKWISIKRLTFLLLIPAMIRSEVKPSGKIKTNKSEISKSSHPERSVTKTDCTLPKKKTIVSEEIIDFPSIEVSFPGGNEALIEFVNDQLQYFEFAIKMYVEGRVFVRFSIQKDGSVTQIKVINRVNETLDKEAKCVIRRMPKWIPAEENVRKVESEYTIPIAFEIN
jgi:TonB family protein